MNNTYRRGALARRLFLPVQEGRQFPNFGFKNGAIVAQPRVHVVCWGDPWNADPEHRTRAASMEQFLKDLLASSFMNILSQYGIGAGAGNAGTFASRSVASGAATPTTDALLRQMLQDQIDAHMLPEPNTSTVVIVYLADGMGLTVDSPSCKPGDPSTQSFLCNPGGSMFGYHDNFATRAGNRLPYAVIPALDDACVQASCTDHCSLDLTQTRIARLTQVTSHEFAEMVSDPMLDGWIDWSDDACNHGLTEIGDLCNGYQDTIHVSGRTWTVQRIYSYAADVAGEGTVCFATLPNPLPFQPQAAPIV